jgi:hypothetical protein
MRRERSRNTGEERKEQENKKRRGRTRNTVVERKEQECV